VIAGFITASGILIAHSQLKHILGRRGAWPYPARDARSILAHLGDINLITLAIGVAPRRSCSGCARG
jgi:SulP family sulfate permease